MVKRRKKLKKRKKFKKVLIEVTLLVSILLIFLYSIQNRQQPEILPDYSIRIISPLNKTYNISEIPVTVLTEKTVLWIKNSVDNGPEITECERCKYFSRYDWDFEPGTHILTVVASNFENRVFSETIIFTVQ